MGLRLIWVTSVIVDNAVKMTDELEQDAPWIMMFANYLHYIICEEIRKLVKL